MLATAGTAVAAFRTPAVMNLVSRGGFIAMGVSIAAMIGSGMVARSIPYQPGTLGTKQLAWLAHCAVIGAVIAPICLLGGPILTRAAWYTAGMVGGLSTVAVCAPSDKFLYMGGPLAMGLGKITDSHYLFEVSHRHIQELSSVPVLALPFSHRPPLWELGSTLSQSTEVSSSSGPSCCTTLRRSSTGQRDIQWDMEHHLLILSTPAWEFTWTPSTSSSGLLQSWVEAAGGSKSED